MCKPYKTRVKLLKKLMGLFKFHAGNLVPEEKRINFTWNTKNMTTEI